MIRLRLYGRPGCGLCDELEEAVEQEFGARVVIEWRDVDRDPATRERFGPRIPVLASPTGEPLSIGSLDRERLRRYLSSCLEVGSASVLDRR